MEQHQPDELILQRLSPELARKIVSLIQIIGVIMLLTALPMLFIMLSHEHPHAGILELLRFGMQSLLHNPQIFLNVLLLGVFFIVLPLLAPKLIRTERLILDSQGIRYETPVRGIFSMSSSWCLRWAEIKSASLAKYLTRGTLVLKPQHGRQQVLQVLTWRSREQLAALAKLSIFKLLLTLDRQRHRPNPDDIEKSALVQYCKNIGLLHTESRPHKELDFDLAKNPATLISMVIMLILILYGVGDLAGNSEIYIQTPPLGWFILGGATMAVVVAGLLTQRKIPKGNAIGLALMLGGAFGFAMYPGLLRINQVTDEHGLQAVHYRHNTDYSFVPRQQGLPEIRVKPDRYWQSLPMDGDVTFMLRRGGLNFYQVDMDPAYHRMRRWYCLQRIAKKGGDPQNCEHIQ